MSAPKLIAEVAQATGITVAKNFRHRHAATALGCGARTRSGQFAPQQEIARSHRTLTLTLSQHVCKHRRQVRTMAHGGTAAAFYSANTRILQCDMIAMVSTFVYEPETKCAL